MKKLQKFAVASSMPGMIAFIYTGVTWWPNAFSNDGFLLPDSKLLIITAVLIILPGVIVGISKKRFSLIEDARINNYELVTKMIGPIRFLDISKYEIKTGRNLTTPRLSVIIADQEFIFSSFKSNMKEEEAKRNFNEFLSLFEKGMKSE